MALSEDQQKQLLHVGHRVRIWALLRLNPNILFSIEEIANQTGLKVSTVKQGLKFVKYLPRIEARITFENRKKVTRYSFVQIK